MPSATGAALPFLPWPVEVTDDERSTVLTAADGRALRVHRVLDPTAPDTRPETAAGQVSGAWEAADGPRARAVFATVHIRRTGAGLTGGASASRTCRCRWRRSPGRSG
jgi:hypothetical protein